MPFLVKYLKFVFSTKAKRHFKGIREAERIRLASGPKGYESLTGIPFFIAPPDLSFPPARIPFTLRIYRMYRILRYLLIRKRTERRKKQSEKHQAKKEQIRRICYHARKGTLFRVKISNPFTPFLEYLKEQFRKSNLLILLNSTTLFLLSYFFVFTIRLFTKAIAAKTLDISTIIYYKDVDFLIRSSQWTVDAVKVVYSSAPFIFLIISIISLIIYKTFLEEKWMSRLFVFWIFAHSFIQVFGDVMIGSMVNQGFGYVLMYLFLDDTEKLFVSLGSFVFILVTGFVMGKNMLYTGNIYYNFLLRKNRGYFVASQYFLPFILGSCIIFLLKEPKILPFEIAVDSSLLLFLIPAFLRMPFVNDLYFDENPRKIKAAVIPLITAALIAILFRVILGQGIRM
ncbi:MAG: hypothetical protein Q8867_00620 [Bacteroidota bacterium]|nr:hypothetical protein [Bacteroidota bacterium]